MGSGERAAEELPKRATETFDVTFFVRGGKVIKFEFKFDEPNNAVLAASNVASINWPDIEAYEVKRKATGDVIARVPVTATVAAVADELNNALKGQVGSDLRRMPAVKIAPAGDLGRLQREARKKGEEGGEGRREI